MQQMIGSPQESRPTGAIGVFEAKPFFAPELQRQFEGSVIVVRPFRLISDLAVMPTPRVCVLTLESGGAAAVDFVESVRQQPETACVLIVPADRFSDGEWLLREIGAHSVVDKFIQGDELAVICRRLLYSRTQREQIHTHHV